MICQDKEEAYNPNYGSSRCFSSRFVSTGCIFSIFFVLFVQFFFWFNLFGFRLFCRIPIGHTTILSTYIHTSACCFCNLLFIYFSLHHFFFYFYFYSNFAFWCSCLFLAHFRSHTVPLFQCVCQSCQCDSCQNTKNTDRTKTKKEQKKERKKKKMWCWWWWIGYFIFAFYLNVASIPLRFGAIFHSNTRRLVNKYI